MRESDKADPAADEVTLRADRIRYLTGRLSAVQRDLRSTQRDLRVTQRDLRVARQELTRTKAHLAALRRRRAIRPTLALTGMVSRLATLLRRPSSVATSGGTPVSTSGGAEVFDTPGGFRESFRPRVAADASAGLVALRVSIIAEVSGPAPSSSAPLAPGGEALGMAVAGLGWRLTDLPTASTQAGVAARAADVAVALTDTFDPRTLADGVVSIAIVGDDPERWLARPWFDEFDLVLSSDTASGDSIASRSVHRPVPIPTAVGDAQTADTVARAMQDALLAWTRAPRIDIAIGPPNWEDAPMWGDYHLGRALQRAFQRRGYPARLRLRPAWSAPSVGRADVAIHVFGLVERPTVPQQLSVLWIISHPDLVTDAMVSRYDPVFVASDSFAAVLSQRTGRVIHVLHQATDPDRFRPTPGGPVHDLLFVANARLDRPVVSELTPTGLDLAIYGRGWTPDLLDPRHLRGDHVPNEELAAYYSAASITLSDHWADMAAQGFFSNRLYDAAASGAFVISDHVPGIDAEFHDGIVTYRDGAELRDLVGRYLADPAARADRAHRARAAVMAAHTFDRRVDDILRIIGPRLAGPPVSQGPLADA